MSRSTSRAAGDLTQHTSRLVGYALVAIFLMALDQRGQYLDRFHQAVRHLTEPVLLAIEAPIRWAGAGSDWLRSTQALLQQNEDLTETVRQQQAAALSLDALVEENKELRALLGLDAAAEQEFITARVISVDLNPFSHRVVIDRGQRHGIVTGLAVVDQGGLVGQVDTVTALTASVILITDPDHALPVRVARTADVTLAYGGGLDNDLSLPDLPMNMDLVIGDELITSGLGGVFPPGLPVARIEAIDRPEGQSFAVASATPFGQHDRSRFVMVVKEQRQTPEPATETDEPSEADPLQVDSPETAPADGGEQSTESAVSGNG